ncbi:hypothetical protein A2W14_05210 [Candidatus Gottesmanbacteria bacterium RBG_16_37_8]|uniref:PIN domain-containing protein n=1 Tax=Candidatus Gottesmanbacteria bacterium RBG_16_37_8 TaxID=1798371 RepID=A0A1F5YSJ1_9BACT|nr:MAG: hypothetical protein A2W14_05210 [Candidatus Gottesmanbacteria bacterium RBG_16_37_8]
MKYLLDTDVIINHIRGKKAIDKKVISEGSTISIISYGELLYGACKSKNKEKSLNLISSFLNDLSIKIINLDEKIMREYAEVKTALEKIGNRLDEFDLLIGITAKLNSLTLKTGNIKHYQRIPGLKVV